MHEGSLLSGPSTCVSKPINLLLPLWNDHPIRHQLIFSHCVMLCWLASRLSYHVPLIILIIIHVQEFISKVSSVLLVIHSLVDTLVGTILLQICLELSCLKVVILLYAVTLSLGCKPTSIGSCLLSILIIVLVLQLLVNLCFSW